MKQKTNKLAQFKKWILSIVVVRFKKIHIHNYKYKKDVGLHEYYKCSKCDKDYYISLY